MQPGNTQSVLLNNRYKVLNVLGDGGFGQTYLAEDMHMPSNRKCVIKQLKPVHDRPELQQIINERFQREAAILEQLGEGHEQIPRLLANFQEKGQFYLVEEWVPGLTLTQLVQREGAQSEKTVQEILSHLLPVVQYIHGQNIVHRDIKPDNIILRKKDRKPVLIDFGAVKETMKTVLSSGQQSTRSIVVGTPGYMPSEQLSGRPVYASDIYSIGMTAIYLLTGNMPQELNTDLSTGALKWREQAPEVSAKFANFLDCASHVNLHSRFSNISEMQTALNAMMISPVNPDVSTYISSDKSNNIQPALTSAPPARAAEPVRAAKLESEITEKNSPNPTPSPQNTRKRTTNRSVSGHSTTQQQKSTNIDSNQKKSGLKLPFIAAILLVLGLAGAGTAGFLYKQAQNTQDNDAPSSQEFVLKADGEREASVEPPVADVSEEEDGGATENLQESQPNNQPNNQQETDSGRQTTTPSASTKTRAERIDDIADGIFSERHPELNGRKIRAGETALIAEWESIRACEAVVDFIYYENHPELNGRKIPTGDSSAQSEWTSIKNGVAGCRSQTTASSGNSSASGSSSNSSASTKTRSQQIDDMADVIFNRRHPELNGRSIRPGETNLSREWASIRACDAIVDFTYYERYPERAGQTISSSNISAQQDWLAIKNSVAGCR
ncbi:MAG: serine/threonine-protein kinase [Cyanobacteria bacterium J06649_4]